MKFDKRMVIAAIAAIAVLCAGLAFVLVTGIGLKPTLTAAEQAKQNSGLIDAATAGNLAKVNELIAAGADVNAKNADFYTALFAASATGLVGSRTV